MKNPEYALDNCKIQDPIDAQLLCWGKVDEISMADFLRQKDKV